MALFGNSDPIVCAVCGAETGTSDSKKHKISGGYICHDCLRNSGHVVGLEVRALNANAISAEIEAQAHKLDALSAFAESRRVHALRIDDDNQKWFLAHPEANEALLRIKPSVVYDFADIESSEILEDGGTVETVKRSGLGRAVVGGVLFGGVGAIVGSTTGKSIGKSKPFVERLSVRIQLKGGVGSVSYDILSSGVKTSSIIYKNAIEQAKNLMSAIESMINAVATTASADEPVPLGGDATDELRKFKSLLDDGIITQEEFDAKKKQLLGI